MSKLVINLDSTSLGHSACILDFYGTVVGSLDESGQSAGGYREKLHGPELVYGIGLHKFIDIAYKTNGNLQLARKHGLKLFNEIPTREHPKKPWLRDQGHLTTVCFNLWNDYVVEENNFQLIELVLPCWLCKGTGIANPQEGSTLECVPPCPHCKGEKMLLQPATEVTFSIKYYEDDYIIVNLCGTIDKIGKFKNGCYAIGDWKTTGTWDNTGYFQQYELSRQLRMYSLALKLMAAMHPDSVLGQLGRTQVGCFIDAVFLDKDPNKTEFIRSDVIPIKPHELDAFQMTLDDQIKRLSNAVKTGYTPKEGIINGSCIKWQSVSEKNFVKCWRWDACKSPDNVAEVLLKRDFTRVQFNPLKYNEV
jgi:PD-(D/E)XK nuclease superfamily